MGFHLRWQLRGTPLHRNNISPSTTERGLPGEWGGAAGLQEDGVSVHNDHLANEATKSLSYFGYDVYIGRTPDPVGQDEAHLSTRLFATQYMCSWITRSWGIDTSFHG